jgi:hypothetical protein
MSPNDARVWEGLNRIPAVTNTCGRTRLPRTWVPAHERAVSGPVRQREPRLPGTQR